jgi:uncharacterized protein YkwD
VRASLLVAGVLVVVGCGGADRPGPPASDAAADPGRPDLAFCVEETNRYRARVGASPVVWSQTAEAYAALAARADAVSNTPHGYTSGPAGPTVAFAENEAIRWPVSPYGSVRGVIDAALAAFWAEGPGGPHYENMRGAWREVGCGVHVEGGEVTLVQHFR